MAEILTKLRPDRDLQCYFFEPTAVAALSGASATGFTLSGSWRQQVDWAVLEWNRDNVFEHPAIRNLPDGDLSGLHLSYLETRDNCIPLDSILYPTVDWPYLRLWADSGGIDTVYQVPLAQYATTTDAYVPATARFELRGTPTSGDYIELAWLDQHYNYCLHSGDMLEAAVAALAGIIESDKAHGMVSATADGAVITLTYLGAPGSNGNRVGVYGTIAGAATETWDPPAALFQGGSSPQRWQVDLDFGNLRDIAGARVPTTNVRKLRWTWAADLQAGSFVRSDFVVLVTGWIVSGSGLQYQVAGTGSRRIEDGASDVAYQGAWNEERGNYSGGSIRWSTTPGSSLTCSYEAPVSHTLYLGTRRAQTGGRVIAQVDSNPPVSLNLALTGEDALVRIPLEKLSGQTRHTVTLTHSGENGSFVYFDFLEIALPSGGLPDFESISTTSLATDWDTNHSLAIAPERTAWLIQKLGFHGRANHYAGALWFYELCCPSQHAASATATFTGVPEFGRTTTFTVAGTRFQHLTLLGDTAESIAKCFELLINSGATGVRAESQSSTLIITSRQTGAAGNSITLTVDTGGSTQFHAQTSAATLTGGMDGRWLTDLTALPRMNRAARDWHASFFAAMKAYGISVVASFSMELGNGDDTVGAGIAQRYPDGTPAWLNTPALQTNFGPASTAFWQETYLDMARIMAQAGVTPYVQFGEVQWWYFSNPSGMPFYDAYTKSMFQSLFSRAMATIVSQNADPSAYPEECGFLPGLVGAFTDTVVAFVRQSQPNTEFEVLYPPDVNDTALNRIINFPENSWTSSKLACLKTENFTYTGDRNLDKARQSIDLPRQYGFPASKSSHLVGISDYTTPWMNERNLALAAGMESVVLFALDQLCLIGYKLPIARSRGRSGLMGI
jgi:hypothetical protein